MANKPKSAKSSYITSIFLGVIGIVAIVFLIQPVIQTGIATEWNWDSEVTYIRRRGREIETTLGLVTLINVSFSLAIIAVNFLLVHYEINRRKINEKYGKLLNRE